MTADATSAADLLARVRTGDWLDAQTFPPLAWAVPGIIPEGFGLLVGAPKAGKSWTALGVALAISSGGVALGAVKVGAPRPVLYLALEDGDRRIQSRARDLLGPHEPIPPLLHYVTRATPHDVVRTVEAWLAHHFGERPLVVLDTLGKVMPVALAGESSYQRDYRVGGTLKTLADESPGASLLVVHHTRKSTSEDFVDTVSGTHGLAGAADFVLVLTRQRGDHHGLLAVTGRDVAEETYALAQVGASWQLDGSTLVEAARAARAAASTAGLGQDQARVVEFIAAHPDGVSPGKVAEHMGWDDRKTGTYLGRLVEADRVARPSRGVYTLTPTPPVGSVGSVGS